VKVIYFQKKTAVILSKFMIVFFFILRYYTTYTLKINGLFIEKYWHSVQKVVKF